MIVIEPYAHKEYNVAEMVRKNESDFTDGNTIISKYVTFDLSENLDRIDAYLNSKHTSGETDSMGREKPFFNIVTAAVNIWYRATDLDRKQIRIKATKMSDEFTHYIATCHLQDWMRRENFGVFLNEWGRTLARYGSAVVKFIETEGKLHCMVVPWNRLILDAIDIDNAPVIEVLELTPAQLRKRKGYDKDMVKQLIDAQTTRETVDKQKKDTKSNFIKIYEVHGELSLACITGKEEDKDEYVEQMHVISFVAKKENAGEYDDYCLIKGRESKNPYMLTHLIKEDGRVQSIGAVEHLFEVQWMENHTQKNIKDQLDLSSKIVFQTSDPNFVGQNATHAIETGDILIHAVNQPLNHLANNANDITSLQNFSAQWKSLGNEIAGVSESMLGNTAPSGTAWRQVDALLQESHSLFETMTENKALDLEGMLRTYVIPFVKKQMDTTEEITATLDAYGIDKIDARYIRNTAIKNIKERVRESVKETGEIPPQDMLDLQMEMQGVKEGLAESGNTRFFKPSVIDGKTWKEALKDLEWELEVDIVGESTNAEALTTTANTFLTFLARKNGQPITPEERFWLNKIMSATGMASPLELSDIASQPSPIQPQQVAAPPVTA